LLWIHARLAISEMISALSFVRLVQAVMGATSCLLLTELATQLADRRVGLVAGLMAAAYGPLIFFDLEWLPASLLVFMLLVAIRCAYRLEQHEAIRQPRVPGLRWFALGLLLGAATLVRMNLAPFALMLALWGWWRQRWRRSWRALIWIWLAFALGFGAPLGLCAYRNFRVSGHLGLVYGGGLNFYLGNNADWRRTSEARPGPAWRRIFTLPGVSPEVDPGKWDRAYFKLSQRWIEAHPEAFREALLVKARRLVAGHERRRNFDLYRFRRYSRVQQLLVWHPGEGLAFPFALLAPLALLGLCFRLAHWRDDLPLLLFLFSYALPFLLFFITARYRLPLAVVLLFFASVALVELWRRLPLGLIWLVPVVALAVLASEDRQPAEPRYEAELSVILGDAAKFAGQPAAARGHYLAALRDWHEYPDALGRLADLAEGEQDLPRAFAYYDRAIAGDKWSWELYFRRGKLHQKRGLWSAALSDYQQALALRPDVAFLLVHIGRCYLAENRRELAISMFQQALLLKPGDPEATRMLRLAEKRPR